jgi:hypothetical protein
MDPGEASLAWQPSSIPTQLQKLILADSVWFVFIVFRACVLR